VLWKFGHAAGLFRDSSYEVYLESYKAKESLWIQFTPLKFADQNVAFEQEPVYYLHDVSDEVAQKDTFGYHLGLLNIAVLLIKNYHADVTGSDYEWSEYRNEASGWENVLTRCIRAGNWKMLLFLFDMCADEIKPLVNRACAGLNWEKTGEEVLQIFYPAELFIGLMYGSAPVNAFFRLNPMSRTDRAAYTDWWCTIYHDVLKAFYKAGADFSKKMYTSDGCRTIREELALQKNTLPAGAVPEEILC